MYIYIASSSVFRALCLYKIGSTKEPIGRRSVYLTGCPPGLTPCQDIDYDALWETTAETREALYDMEDEIHNYFRASRMMRERPGDTEWFNFKTIQVYDTAIQFIQSRPWIKRRMKLNEIEPPKRPSYSAMTKHYKKNLQYIKIRSQRIERLNAIQEPVVSNIAEFMNDATTRAGYVIAPCGAGKTRMTVQGIRGVRKCIICCPSKHIQTQWRDTLETEGLFVRSQMYLIGSGSDGTTEPEIIRAMFQQEIYCVITTYMSSHLLLNCINEHTEVLVIDEAHHMAGIVATEETGDGRTRKLMVKACELNVKRLSLTYTPRFILNEGINEMNPTLKILTMDDDAIFGKKIYALKIRDLIRQGVLPDYLLWTLADKEKKGTGLMGKAECILNAWDATEMVRGDIQYILHHLVIFARNTDESKQLEMFFKAKTQETLVLRVEQGDDLETPIAQFTKAPRAIFINCRVLNEGVDIPIANAVAITYTKKARGQITQMVLRPGRWYENKPLFHILIPTLEHEDYSGLEEVLTALASNDDEIRDEIVLSSNTLAATGRAVAANGCAFEAYPDGSLPEHIKIDEYQANEEDIRRCFSNIRQTLFPAKESRRIQRLCLERGIQSSIEYAWLRIGIPELPEDPRPKGVSWYDYLHPSPLGCSVPRMSPRVFVETLLEPKGFTIAHQYDAWRTQQSPDILAQFPSVQHINDGYFGKDAATDFNRIFQTFKCPDKKTRR